MGKRKKNKGKHSKAQTKRHVYRRGKLCTIELDCGVSIDFRKTRSSVLQDMINATPVLQRTIDFATKVYRAASQKMDLNTIKVPDLVEIPGHEIESLWQFFADNTIEVHGVEDEAGERLYWATLSEHERLDFYETLAPGELFNVYGQYLAYMAADADPQMRAGI